MKKIFLLGLVCVIFTSCVKVPEMTLEEIQQYTQNANSSLITNSVSKPWNSQKFVAGHVEGVWYDTILADPKTFNQLIAERDSASASIIDVTLDYLVDYDASTRKWKPHCAFYDIEVNKEKNTLTVHYTLRDNLYWTYYNSTEKIPVTSDDFVYWYNHIAADKAFGSSGYSQQFVTMPDGTEKRIECVKIDEKRFDFIFPRIVAEPLLATNMSLCPSFIFKKAKDNGGVEGVKNLFSIDINPQNIPSCGKWYITEYTPGQRIVFTRNPNYWEKDTNETSIPYTKQMIYQIIGDANTNYLLFKQGKTETYYPRPEEISDVIANQKDEYTVFNSNGSLSAPLWSFNQNPKNSSSLFYSWFTNKKFRQAMSCLLNRERIINQTYRDLAEPKYSFFPDANPFYNPEITLQYRYDPSRALKLLSDIGFYKDKDNILHDPLGNIIEYDLTVPSSNTVINDIAQIISDECSKVGIKVNVRQTDFQKIIEMLTSTYDWQSVIIGLGANLFPSQGSNVWPSSGNLHLWHPLQEAPSTEWEKRIDYLYNEGCYTNDYEKAKVIWDEYQRLILEECPIIYLVRSKSFFAIRNKWDLSNVYFDNKNGAVLTNVFLKR